MTQSVIDPQSAAIAAAAAAALFIKGLAFSYIQIAARYRARSFSRPEDARLVGLEPKPDPDLANRAGAVLRNESENSPVFMVIALGYVLLGGEPLPLLYVSAVYIAARYFQGYAQYRALQPHRMIGYLIAVVATLSLTVMTALHAKMWEYQQ